jgi:hypothetical protein
MRSAPNDAPVMISLRMACHGGRAPGTSSGSTASLTMSSASSFIAFHVAAISSDLTICAVSVSWSAPSGRSSFSAPCENRR